MLRYAEMNAWLASLSYASGFKRAGHRYLDSVVMALSIKGVIFMNAPLPTIR